MGIDFILYRDLYRLIEQEANTPCRRTVVLTFFEQPPHFLTAVLEHSAALIHRHAGRAPVRSELQRLELEVRNNPRYARKLALRLARYAARLHMRLEGSAAIGHNTLLQFPAGKRKPDGGER